MSAFAELIERLEKLEGPDRELDCAIYRAQSSAVEQAWRYWGPDQRKMLTPHYTSSIDAALTLVPDRFAADTRRYSSGTGRAVIWRQDGRRFEDDAATPAIALCITALRARALTQDTPS